MKDGVICQAISVFCPYENRLVNVSFCDGCEHEDEAVCKRAQRPENLIHQK